MSIFAVIQQNADGAEGTLEASVRGLQWATYPVQTNVWLVAYAGTAHALCDELKVTPDGAMGTAVVVEVSSYYGRANPAIWTWIKENWRGTPLG